jgi:hypothetical protein
MMLVFAGGALGGLVGANAGRSSTPGSMSNVPVACTRPVLLGRELYL